MNFNQLMYFIDIAKTGSINETAKRLYVSQPTVTDSIKRLEKELGTTLLRRSHMGVELTNDGKTLLGYALPITEQYNALQNHFQHRTLSQKSIHLATASLFTNTLLSDLIFEMQARFPNIALYSNETEFKQILDDCAQEKVHFGLSGISPEESTLDIILKEYEKTLHYQLLFQSPLVSVVHRSHPLATKNEILYEELLLFPFTAYQHNIGEYNIPDTALHVSNNMDIHKRFLREKHTTFTTARYAARKLFSEKEFIYLPIINRKPVNFYLIYKKDNQFLENEIYQAFIQTIVTLTKDL